MEIKPELLDVFKNHFNLNDKFGNEELESLKYIQYSKILKHFLIGFKLNEGSTEFGFKDDKLIVGGKWVSLSEKELKLIVDFFEFNKEHIETTLV